MKSIAKCIGKRFLPFVTQLEQKMGPQKEAEFLTPTTCDDKGRKMIVTSPLAGVQATKATESVYTNMFVVEFLIEIAMICRKC